MSLVIKVQQSWRSQTAVSVREDDCTMATNIYLRFFGANGMHHRYIKQQNLRLEHSRSMLPDHFNSIVELLRYPQRVHVVIRSATLFP